MLEEVPLGDLLAARIGALPEALFARVLVMAGDAIAPGSPRERLVHELIQLLKTAPPEAIDDPHRLARLILPNGGNVLRWHREQFYEFDEYAYHQIETAEIRAKITRGIKREFDRHASMKAAADITKAPPTCKKVTGRVASDTMRALESLAMLPGKIEPPARASQTTAT